MPEPVHQLISLIEARPFVSAAVLIATILYVRLMMSGPRVY